MYRKTSILTLVVGICCIVNPTTGQQPNTANPSQSAVPQSNRIEKKHLSLSFDRPATKDGCDKHSIVKTNDTGFSPLVVYDEVMNLVKMSSKILEQLSFRLPRTVIPKRYDLLMHPDLKRKTFNGTVKISVDVLEPVEFIAMHSKYLNITKVLLQNNKDQEVSLKATSDYEKYELFVLETCNTIDKGQYSISLEFGGSLDNRIVGFYGSVYEDEVRNMSRLWSPKQN
jgi:Peptidase M1 N-terminal domain